MMREVIARNQVTTIFQNGERFRTSKLNRQSSSDMAVRWLLETYCNLNAIRETLVIIPVNISCDRIQESLNLANEMINGTKDYYTLYNIMQRARAMSKNEIGDVYVKYLEPINLHEYLR